MPRNTKFSASWLDGKKDNNGDLVSSWCRGCPNDNFAAYCKMCVKQFSVANMGFSQILSHANSLKHKKIMKEGINQCTFSVKNVSQDSDGNNILHLAGPQNKQWIPTSMREKTLRAEAIILLTAIKCNYSFSSLNDLGNLFAVAFEDSEIAKNVKMSDPKARYLAKFGLAPYFQKQTFCELSSSSSPYFTIYFDETTTKQVKKQLDIYVSYWSKKIERVTTVYCNSFFLGHADSDKILEIILNFVSDNGLCLEKLLQCSMDGPNVNLAFLRKMNAHLNSLNIKCLIDVGTCSLHISHTSMKKGLAELECDVEGFVLQIFYYFQMSAARREDFHEVQLSVLVGAAAKHLFQKHVESRWLTLGPVCERMIEQYPALKEYFLNTLAKSNVKINEKTTKIINFLRDPKNLMYIHFTAFYCNIFMPYLTLFQKQTPQIHVLYNKQCELVRSVMFKFLKSEAVGNKEGLSLKNIDCQDASIWLPLKKINIGSGAEKLLNYPEHKDFLHNIRKVYMHCTQYLKQKLSLCNPVLQNLQYIHPANQKNPRSKQGISHLIDQMIKIADTDKVCDNIKSEYLMYMCEDLSQQHQNFSKDNDICMYWSEVEKIKDSCGNFKYGSLTKFVKSCLTLSHGNVVPECGFSINKSIVTQERSSLSEMGICSLRICRDNLKTCKSVADLVTKDMLQYMQKAHAEYLSYLDQVKSKQEEAAVKRKNDEEESEQLLKKRKEKETLQDTLSNLSIMEETYLADEAAAQSLLSEGTEKLRIAVKNNDFNEVKVSQMMLDTANSNLKEISKNLNVTRTKMSGIQKKIQNLH